MSEAASLNDLERSAPQIGVPIYRILNPIMLLLMTLLLFSFQPFILSQFASSFFRQGLFVLITALFFFYFNKMLIKHFMLIGLVFIWLFIYTQWVSDAEQVHQCVMMASFYIWSIVFHQALISGSRLKDLFSRYYMMLSVTLASFSILSVGYYFLFNRYFFNLPLTVEHYNYYATPFGVILDKTFFNVHVIRACNYFVEPVLASLFFAGNVFLIDRSEPLVKYRMINLIAGLLLFSYSFFIFCLYFYFIQRLKKVSFFYLVAFLLVATFLSVYFDEILAFSSASDRTMRVQLFFQDVSEWTGFEWVFGEKNSNLVREFEYNMGLMQLVWYYGLFGLLVYLAVIYVFCARNRVLLGAVFIASLIFNPALYPIYYFMPILFGVTANLKLTSAFGKRVSN